ncbi:heterogeneous nuclear ribonucleoprotein Q-like isoform X3 [Phragmites australis]|uniref:heterogeneous nuclear ribonucleoprotein Q-like isoform X3 n=1 Tax=Phragmites australis TaxID=29695 RepID=UPI002D782CA2|nr:heterogeneous nuclear ribonucleoprotein Q-like isoform X3 [Phragmites australis]
MPPAGMAPSAADESSSPAPAVTEGETPGGVVAAGVGGAIEEGAEGNAMEVESGAAAAVEEFGEEPEEATGVELDDEEAEEGEGDAGEEEEEAAEDLDEAVKKGGDEETVMEPLAVVKPGEAQENAEEPREKEGEEDEPSEMDVESKEAASEKEGEGIADDAMKAIVEGSAVHDMNELPKEEPGEFGGDGKHGDNNQDGVADQSNNNGDAGGSGNCDAQNGELAGDLEIFVDELPKDCVEEDFAMVFSQCGEIKSVRIIKNPSTEKSKDIAFVCYANIEAAKKALAEFKEGIEVKGKNIRVSACQDHNTLYLGNICKSWTKDQVLNTLKSMGIGQLEVNLRTDKKGRNRGFAFLEFASHYYARAAFHQLMRPDAIFGIDRSVKVSFARTRTEPSEEFLMEVKTVYLEHVPLSWDEGKIKECCEGYGNIQNVNLFQISNNTEKNFFSFVEFSSSKSALACVEGINSAKIVDGGFKLSASLARPKGEFKINSGAASEDANTSKKKKDHTEEDVVKNSPHKPEGSKRKLTSRTKGVAVKRSPNNLPKGNVLTVPSNTTYLGGYARGTGQPAGPQYAPNSQGHPSVRATSRSKAYASDLEPHAGYIPPTNRVRSTHADDRQRNAQYTIHQTDVPLYARETVDAHPAYSGYTSHAISQAGYAYVYPPVPPRSGSYYPGSGLFIPRRGDY